MDNWVENHRGTENIMSESLTIENANVLVCRRVSGFGDMLSQLAHCIVLSDKTGCPVYVDWRNVLYSNSEDSMFNIFGSYVFHNKARPVEVLIPLLEKEKKRLIEAQKYVANIDSSIVHGVISDQLNFHKVSEISDILLITGPVHIKDKGALYQGLSGVSFCDEFKAIAYEKVSRLGNSFNSIHYRHGNGEFSDFKKRQDHADEIKSIFDIYKKNHADLDFPIYISTDSIEADEIFDDVFSEYKNLIYSDKPDNNFSGAIHYSPIAGGVNDVDMLEVLKSAAVDMLVMSYSCNIYRDPWSSFTNYSCAIASQQEGFNEIHYPVKRKKFSELSSSKVYKDAVKIVASRFSED